MAQQEEIVLDVKLDAQKVAGELAKATQQIAYLKQEQKLLNDALKEGKISEEDYGKAMAQSSAELEKATRSSKGYTAQLKVLTKETGEYGDSLNEERRKLNDMQKAYDELSAEIRESSAGKEFLKQIQAQDKAVKEMENSTGRFGRSVGSYEEALKNAGVGISGFTAKMKAFFANPWALLLAAIVGAFKKLIDAFKSSEERTKEMQRAFAPLKAIGDVITQVFDKLAASLSKLVGGALKKVTEGVGWLFRAIDKLAKKVGLDWNLSEAFEQAAENSRKATEAEQKYAEHRRRWITQEAKLEKDIAILRDKSVQKDKYSTEERVAFLEEALEKERKIADEKVKLAKENLAYLTAEAARSENDAEMNDKLAEAKAAVTRAETDYYKTTKELNAQIIAFRKEEQAETKKESADAEKDLRDKQKRSKASLDYRLAVAMAAIGEEKKYSQEAFDINQQYFKDLLALYAEDSAEYATALKAKVQYEEAYEEKRKELAEKAATFLAQFDAPDTLRDKYEQQLRQLEEFHSQQLVLDEEYEQAKAQLQEQYRLQQAQADAEMAQQFLSQTQALNSAISGIEDAALAHFEQGQDERKKALEKRLQAGQISEEQYAKETQKIDEETERKKIEIEREQAIREKAMGIMQATIDTAMAIIKALADPGGFAGLALSALAGVTGAAQIAAIAAQPLPQFATGGVVGGTSYTGDRVQIRANSGEMVLTKEQQARLFDAVSSSNDQTLGIDYGMMAQAMSSVPAPVMVYTELQEFGDRVATIQEIASV